MNACLIVSRSLVFDYEYHSTVQEGSISWALVYFWLVLRITFPRFSCQEKHKLGFQLYDECRSARGKNADQPKTHRLEATKIEP